MPGCSDPRTIRLPRTVLPHRHSPPASSCPSETTRKRAWGQQPDGRCPYSASSPRPSMLLPMGACILLLAKIPLRYVGGQPRGARLILAISSSSTARHAPANPSMRRSQKACFARKRGQTARRSHNHSRDGAFFRDQGIGQPFARDTCSAVLPAWLTPLRLPPRLCCAGTLAESPPPAKPPRPRRVRRTQTPRSDRRSASQAACRRRNAAHVDAPTMPSPQSPRLT